MVHELKVDNEGNVILDSGAVIGSYKVLDVNELGAIVEFNIRDEVLIKQLQGGVTHDMSVGYVPQPTLFDVNPHIKPFH